MKKAKHKFQTQIEKVEEEWGFEELKIVRQLAMAAVDAEDQIAEVSVVIPKWGD